jgi:hypothetical protein
VAASGTISATATASTSSALCQPNWRLPGRQYRELAERAAGADDAQRHAAFLRRRVASDDAHHHGVAGAGQADADQQAGRQVQRQRVASMGHQDQAEGVGASAAGQRPPRSPAVGDGAGQRRGDAPDDVLECDGEGKGFASPAMGLRHRL